MGRVLVANFDCELSWARSAFGAHLAVKAAIVPRLSRLADALLELASDAALWRVGDAPLLDAREALAWGVTAELEAAGLVSAADSAPDLSDDSWLEWLWRVRPTSEQAARVNDRRFATEVGRSLSPPCPSRAFAASLSDIDARIAEVPAGAQWLLKAPLSASGREQIRRRGPLEGEQRAHAERLLARFPVVLVERWRDRTVDVGVAGFVGDDRAIAFAPHRMQCDSSGVFRGIDIDDGGDWLGQRSSVFERAARVAGVALHEQGYRGPFGIDGYIYRADDGSERVQPLSEINARLTFGHVARAQWERAGRPALHRLAAPPSR